VLQQPASPNTLPEFKEAEGDDQDDSLRTLWRPWTNTKTAGSGSAVASALAGLGARSPRARATLTARGGAKFDRKRSFFLKIRELIHSTL
jgi:hypothetical protein